jgi:hypothetical protein
MPRIFPKTDNDKERGTGNELLSVKDNGNHSFFHGNGLFLSLAEQIPGERG